MNNRDTEATINQADKHVGHDSTGGTFRIIEREIRPDPSRKDLKVLNKSKHSSDPLAERSARRWMKDVLLIGLGFTGTLMVLSAEDSPWGWGTLMLSWVLAVASLVRDHRDDPFR